MKDRMAATNDGTQLLWLTKRQKLCVVTNPPMRAPDNPEISVVFNLQPPPYFMTKLFLSSSQEMKLSEHSSSY